jgi:hypothetical protein
MPETAEKQQTQAEKEIIELALQRFKTASDAEFETRRDSVDDLEFSIGNQWPLNIKTQRERKNKPCLVMDQIQQSIRLVCNGYRQQRPSINVNPIGDGADVDTAEILQGVVRHVEVISDAEIAYDWSHECVVRTGFGSWRMLNEYADDDSDDQEIFLKPIRNQFTVYWQPGVPHHEAKWAFIVADETHEEYKDEYSDSSLSQTNFTSTGDAPPEWVTKETVRVAEYFEIKEEKGKGKRPKKKVIWRKINAFEILDGGVDGKRLPGTSIPIFTAVGDDIDVNGKRYLAGLVRNAKGPQRMYNYFCSSATQTMALAPVSPVMTVEGSISGYEKLWEAANTGDVAVLTYKQIDVQGKPAPPPTHFQTEPPIEGVTMMIRQASMDLKAATGLYDPSLGQRRGDESGKAIERLQSQGDVATLNYSDNMAREMRRCGRVMLEWIRELYEVPRIQRIIKPDGSVSQVVIHNGPEQAEEAKALAEKDAEADPTKIKKIYDIGIGRYDVAVSVGPSYQSKRQEAVATQMDIIKSDPQVMPIIGDILFSNMDIPGAQEISKRLKKMLPPQLQDMDDPDSQIQQLKAQHGQLVQETQVLTQQLQKAQQEIATKQVEQQGKLAIEQLKEQSAMTQLQMKLDTQVAIAQVTAKTQDIEQRIQWLQDVWTELHGAAHDAATQASEQQHQKEMAAAAQAHQADMAASGQAADAQSQQLDQQHQAQMAAQQAVGSENGGE